jgi:hypothetical protein
MGSGDTEDEVLFVAGAHMYYYEDQGDDCDIVLKHHTTKEEA